jgi:hypothetical protein
MIGFIDTSVRISLNYNHYSVIAGFYNLQLTVAQALEFYLHLLSPDNKIKKVSLWLNLLITH